MKRLASLLLVCAALILIPLVRAQHGHGGAETAGSAGHSGHGPSRVWVWANFFLLGGGLGYLAAKQGGPFFKQRGEQIRKGIEEASRLKTDAEARAAAIEKRLASLAADIEQLRQQGAREMAAESERIASESRQAAARIRADAEQEIAAAAKSARRQLRIYAADLALQLAEEKIRAELTAESDAGLLQDFAGRLRRLAEERRN